jgi:hypothetical protein
MFTKIAPQFRKVLYKWTSTNGNLYGLKNPFQALVPIANTHLNKFDNTP